MSTIKKFVTFRKPKKSTSSVAINTDCPATSPLPILGYPALTQGLNRLEAKAQELKDTLDKRSRSLESVTGCDEYGKSVVLRTDSNSLSWCDLRETRSFQINSVRDLFNTNYRLSGRFLPPSEQLLNLSAGEVHSAIDDLEALPREVRNFCRHTQRLDPQLPPYVLNEEIFLPVPSQFLNQSDNSVQIALALAESEQPLDSEKGELVRIKRKVLRRKREQTLINFLDVARQLPKTKSGPKLIRRLKLANRTPAAGFSKLGRYSAENKNAPSHNSTFTPFLPDPNSLSTTTSSTKPRPHPRKAASLSGEAAGSTAAQHLNSEIDSDHDSTVSEEDMSFVPMDNNVLKWYSQLIPMLEIKQKEYSATAIKTFMERCRHACKSLDDEQERTFLFTIICRMSNDVVKRLKKFTFDSLEDLETALKDAHPQASNREYILEQIRSSRQRENEGIEDFVNRLRDLVERGLSEDLHDEEYERAAIIALKKGIKSDVVYLQLLQLKSDATFKDMAVKAIVAEQDVRMRNRTVNEVRATNKDVDIVEEFKRVLSALETKTVNTISASQRENSNPFSRTSTMYPQPPEQLPPPNRGYNPTTATQYRQNVVCYNCGRIGHYRSECRQRRPNFGFQRPNYQPQPRYTNYPTNNSGNVGNSDRCEPPPSAANQSDRSDTCGLCGLQGHTPTTCVRNQAGASSTNPTGEKCQLCEGFGHIARNCHLLRPGNCSRSAQ